MCSSAQGETFTKIDHNSLQNLLLQIMEMLEFLSSLIQDNIEKSPNV